MRTWVPHASAALLLLSTIGMAYGQTAPATHPAPASDPLSTRPHNQFLTAPELLLFEDLPIVITATPKSN